jgi:cytochrome c
MKAATKVVACAAVVLLSGSAWAADVDTAAAEALMKKSGCGKCHSLSAKKEGPSYKDTAAKYKGKGDAMDALVKHLTTSPTVKVGGADEKHPNLASKNEADVKNVVGYILSR